MIILQSPNPWLSCRYWPSLLYISTTGCLYLGNTNGICLDIKGHFYLVNKYNWVDFLLKQLTFLLVKKHFFSLWGTEENMYYLRSYSSLTLTRRGTSVIIKPPCAMVMFKYYVITYGGAGSSQIIMID